MKVTSPRCRIGMGARMAKQRASAGGLVRADHALGDAQVVGPAAVGGDDQVRAVHKPGGDDERVG